MVHPVLCPGMLTAAKWTAAALIAISASIASQDPGTKPTPSPAAPPMHLAFSSVKPEATIAVDGERQIAVTPDSVWVSRRAAGTVVRIDPKTHTLGTPILVGQDPCFRALWAFGSLWTSLCGAPGLARIEVPADSKAPAAVKPPVVITLGVRAGGPIVTGASSIWMIADAAGALARVDPDTNKIIAETTVPPGPWAMAFGDGAVWITSASRDTVTRVNGSTNVVVEHVKVGRGPSAVAVGEGAVWTLNTGDGTVSKVDLKTNKVTDTIKAGVTGRHGSIAIGEGSVWLSAEGAPLTRIDPVTNRMIQQFSGPGGGALAVGHQSLWIVATPTEIWRLDPRRVEATRK